LAAKVPLSRDAFKTWLASSATLACAPDLEDIFRGRWDAEPPEYEPFQGSLLELIKQRLMSGGALLVQQRNVLSIYATEVGFYRRWFGNWLALLASVPPLSGGTGTAVFCAETGGHLYAEGVLSLLQVDPARVRCLPGSRPLPALAPCRARASRSHDAVCRGDPDDPHCAEAFLNADVFEFMRYYRSLG
jgi:hypothetical protein